MTDRTHGSYRRPRWRGFGSCVIRAVPRRRRHIVHARPRSITMDNDWSVEQVVGKWFNSLDIRTEELVWARGTKDIPISACSLPCQPGMIKKQQGDTCCWVCDQCEEYEYVYDEYTCVDCGPGKWPHDDKRGCYELPINHIRWNSAFAIAPAVISCLGIVATLAVACLLFHHRDTPVVRASGRELTIILLAGVLVCYLNTFLLLATPTTVTCILQRFGVGVSFSAVYGALLTKTNRIARIFDSASRTAVRPRYISPASQVCIAAALIALQVRERDVVHAVCVCRPVDFDYHRLTRSLQGIARRHWSSTFNYINLLDIYSSLESRKLFLLLLFLNCF